MLLIQREREVNATLVPPLDPSLFTPTDTDLAFLRLWISEDDGEIRRRTLEIQKEAYEKYPYPCIRAFHHVSLMMKANPIYPVVLEAGKTGNTVFLDIGCCMGADVRKLVSDSYPASNVLGCDRRLEFIDLGHKLFRDRDSCPIRFLTSDIFDLSVPSAFNETLRSVHEAPPLIRVDQLSQLLGSLTHIYTGALFHLFDETTQYAIALRVAYLLKRESGTIVFGRHRDLECEGMIDDHLGRIRYGHSERSWPLLWKRVFAEVEDAEFAENRVKVQAKLDAPFDQHIPGTTRKGHMLVWSVQIT